MTATSEPADISDPTERLRAAAAEFDAAVVYLNTATLGLPPRRTTAAVRAALQTWQAGTANPVEFDAPLATARRAYAGLVGVDPSWVATGSQVSGFAGLVAASLPAGSEVLLAANEFTSMVFPFLAQVGRGVRSREVPLDRLADAVTTRTTLVAVSAVQSADGRLADLDALVAACEGTDTRLFVDTTQATGWLPVDASRFAFTTGGGYKWLLAPRGTCFFTVRPDVMEQLIPHHASWYAGEQPWDSIYGGPLRLARSARRFDLSPAWHSWVGQEPSLQLLAAVGPAALHDHAVGLANRFRTAVGLAPGRSAIVSVAGDDGAPELLALAGIAAGVRAGRLRLAFHVNNVAADADRAAEVLTGHLRV